MLSSTSSSSSSSTSRAAMGSTDEYVKRMEAAVMKATAAMTILRDEIHRFRGEEVKYKEKISSLEALLKEANLEIAKLRADMKAFNFGGGGGKGGDKVELKRKKASAPDNSNSEKNISPANAASNKASKTSKKSLASNNKSLKQKENKNVSFKEIEVENDMISSSDVTSEVTSEMTSEVTSEVTSVTSVFSADSSAGGGVGDAAAVVNCQSFNLFDDSDEDSDEKSDEDDSDGDDFFFDPLKKASDSGSSGHCNNKYSKSSNSNRENKSDLMEANSSTHEKMVTTSQEYEKTLNRDDKTVIEDVSGTYVHISSNSNSNNDNDVVVDDDGDNDNDEADGDASNDDSIDLASDITTAKKGTLMYMFQNLNASNLDKSVDAMLKQYKLAQICKAFSSTMTRHANSIHLEQYSSDFESNIIKMVSLHNNTRNPFDQVLLGAISSLVPNSLSSKLKCMLAFLSTINSYSNGFYLVSELLKHYKRACISSISSSDNNNISSNGNKSNNNSALRLFDLIFGDSLNLASITTSILSVSKTEDDHSSLSKMLFDDDSDDSEEESSDSIRDDGDGDEMSTSDHGASSIKLSGANVPGKKIRVSVRLDKYQLNCCCKIYFLLKLYRHLNFDSQILRLFEDIYFAAFQNLYNVRNDLSLTSQESSFNLIGIVIGTTLFLQAENIGSVAPSPRLSNLIRNYLPEFCSMFSFFRFYLQSSLLCLKQSCDQIGLDLLAKCAQYTDFANFYKKVNCSNCNSVNGKRSYLLLFLLTSAVSKLDEILRIVTPASAGSGYSSSSSNVSVATFSESAQLDYDFLYKYYCDLLNGSGKGPDNGSYLAAKYRENIFSLKHFPLKIMFLLPSFGKNHAEHDCFEVLGMSTIANKLAELTVLKDSIINFSHSSSNMGSFIEALWKIINSSLFRSSSSSVQIESAMVADEDYEDDDDTSESFYSNGEFGRSSRQWPTLDFGLSEFYSSAKDEPNQIILESIITNHFYNHFEPILRSKDLRKVAKVLSSFRVISSILDGFLGREFAKDGASATTAGWRSPETGFAVPLMVRLSSRISSLRDGCIGIIHASGSNSRAAHGGRLASDHESVNTGLKLLWNLTTLRDANVYESLSTCYGIFDALSSVPSADLIIDPKPHLLDLLSIFSLGLIEIFVRLYSCALRGAMNCAVSLLQENSKSGDPSSISFEFFIAECANMLNVLPFPWGGPSRPDIIAYCKAAMAEAQGSLSTSLTSLSTTVSPVISSNLYRINSLIRQTCFESSQLLLNRIPIFGISCDSDCNMWLNFESMCNQSELTPFRVSSLRSYDTTNLKTGGFLVQSKIPTTEVAASWTPSTGISFSDLQQSKNEITPRQRRICASNILIWKFIAQFEQLSQINSSSGASSSTSSLVEKRGVTSATNSIFTLCRNLGSWPKSLKKSSKSYFSSGNSTGNQMNVSDNNSYNQHNYSFESWFCVLDENAVPDKMELTMSSVREKILSLTSILPEGCDICFLGRDVPFKRDKSLRIIDIDEKLRYSIDSEHYEVVTNCYIIRSSSAAALVGLMPVSAPLPIFFGKLFRESKLNGYLLKEPLFKSQHSVKEKKKFYGNRRK